MKVTVTANLTISDETNPSDIRFSSGNKSFSDTTSYAECETSTFALAASAADLDLPLGSMSLISILYLLAKTTGVKVKITPTGEDPADALEMELVPNVPCILPGKIGAVSVSNTSGSATSLIYAAIGN